MMEQRAKMYEGTWCVSPKQVGLVDGVAHAETFPWPVTLDRLHFTNWVVHLSVDPEIQCGWMGVF